MRYTRGNGAWLSLVERPLWERSHTRNHACFEGLPRTVPCSAFPKDADQTISFYRRLTQAQNQPMRYALLVALVVAAGCSSSPTAPSPAPVTPPVVVVPPVVTPPVVTAPPSLPTSDPRFDLTFYRQFAHNATIGPSYVLWRQTDAPRIYLRTIDDRGAAIDALTLNGTQAALESVAGKLTGKFGLAGLERGTDSRIGQKGWITVLWSNATDSACARAIIGGDQITMFLRTPGCRCTGGPAIAPLIVKHELGHALGFFHTDQRTDLMYPGGLPACDMDPSAREQFHAAVAYTMPFNSPAP